MRRAIPLDSKQIFKDYDSGASITKIAANLGLSKTPIRSALIKEGYKPRSRPKRVKQLSTGRIFDSVAEAAASVDFSPPAITLAIRRGHRSAGSYWEYAD